MYSSSPLLCCQLGPIFGKIPEASWKQVWILSNFVPRTMRRINVDMVYENASEANTRGIHKKPEAEESSEEAKQNRQRRNLKEEK